MNSGTIWVRFMEKIRGRKSRATVPLRAFFLIKIIQALTKYILYYQARDNLFRQHKSLSVTWLYPSHYLTSLFLSLLCHILFQKGVWSTFLFVDSRVRWCWPFWENEENQAKIDPKFKYKTHLHRAYILHWPISDAFTAASKFLKNVIMLITNLWWKSSLTQK